MNFYTWESYVDYHILPGEDPLEAYPRLHMEWKAYQKILQRELRKSPKILQQAGVGAPVYSPPRSTPSPEIDSWQDLRGSLYREQHGLCFWCGDLLGEHWHVDHHLPKVRGGTNAKENLRALCMTCNYKKGRLTPEEFVLIATIGLF